MRPMKIILFLTLAFLGLAQAKPLDDYDRLLRTYITDIGFVDYDAWKANSADVAKLQGFIDYMAAYDPSSLSGAEQVAFWINAYNALVLHEVLERYPIDTVRPSFLGIPERSFFVETKHVIGGKSYGLDQIENDVIRKLGEPRIHFAINCASYSCPKLRAEAYSASKLNEQLNDQATSFINDPVRNQFEASTHTARLSKIFDWFKGDFDVVGGVTSYIAQFAEGEALEVLQSSSVIIEYIPYDWKLNRQEKVATNE
jgi:Protein of unknown function, DUF547